MSADDTSALRLLAAADRVREAGDAYAPLKATAEAAYEEWRVGAQGADGPAYAAWHALASAASSVQRVLERAQSELNALALEPGDCAWALGVLGAAGEYDVAERAFEQVTARRAANKSIREELEHVRALDSRNAAYEALLAAARGAR